MEGLLTIVAVVGGIFLIYIVRGWALALLWSWFMVPFFSLPEISIPLAIGVSLVVGMISSDPAHIKKEYKESSTYQIAFTIMSPILTVFIGFIVKSFL